MLECSWDELWNKVQQARDLDHIIAAHEAFLDSVISRCLLDTNSRVRRPHIHRKTPAYQTLSHTYTGSPQTLACHMLSHTHN